MDFVLLLLRLADERYGKITDEYPQGTAAQAAVCHAKPPGNVVQLANFGKGMRGEQ